MLKSKYETHAKDKLVLIKEWQGMGSLIGVCCFTNNANIIILTSKCLQ